MRKFLATVILAMLAAVPGVSWSAPSVMGPSTQTGPFSTTIKFVIDDTEDSRAIEVSGFCSVRYQQASGDDASLYAVTGRDDAANTGTLIAAFTASTTTATTFTAGTRWVKAVATDATAGGSVMWIDCAPLVGGGGSGSSPFDACRSGNTKGGGYDTTTGRYAWTCGNYNWGQVQGFNDASYYVDCTGDGTPHTSCLRDGEKRLINSLYRAGLAPYYTKDGGTVFFPKFSGKEHGIYVFTGCGPSSDSTENACPNPYDPEIEALTHRSYAHKVSVIRFGQRGVTAVAEGLPEVVDGKSATPELKGVWFVNDVGNDGADGPASAARDGVDDQFVPEWVFGVGYANATGSQYCIDSGDGTFACDLTPSFDNTAAWAYLWTTEHFSDYGTNGKLVANIDLNNHSSDEASGCFQNGIGVCSADNREPCNSTSDCAAGTCTINETTTSATCELDRSVRCWNLTAGANRSDGGCESDDESVDLGTCQPFVDALQADIETSGKDYHLLAVYGACDGTPDDAVDATLCEASDYVTPITIRSFDQALTTACGAIEAAEEINFGTTSLHPNATAGEDENSFFAQRYVIAGSNGDGRQERFFPIEWSKYDLNGAGMDGFGFMPADWYGRSTCESGDDTDSADDQPACDTAALMNHMVGWGGAIRNFIALNASGINKGNVDGAIGAMFPLFADGTIQYGRRNTYTDPNHGWTYDNVTFLENYSAATGFNFFGPLVRVINSKFIGNYAAPLIFGGNAAGIYGVQFRDVEFTGNSSAGNSPVLLAGGSDYEFSGLRVLTDRDEGFFRFTPGGSAYGAREFIKNVSIRDVTYKSLGDTVTGFAYFDCSTDVAASGEFVQGVTFDNIHATYFSNNRVPLVAVVDADANCQVMERAGSVTIRNSTVDSRVGGCIFAHGGNCDTATGNAWGPNDASDWTAIATSSTLPRMEGNAAMNVSVPDWNYNTVAAADVPDCQVLPDGFTVAIRDDITAAGTCGDATSNGLLDGAGTYLSICKCDPAGDAGDGAWSGL
jgi:hypothetical protein